MKYGITFANILTWAGSDALRLAQIAEELGYDSLWTVEHVVLPEGFKSKYPYSPTGEMPGGDSALIPDPLIWLAYVAAQTTKIKLGTGILILPQRNPLMLAKEILTLDNLSKGRFILGVGVGWLKEEFEALGVPFEKRGKRTEEYIAALRELFRANPASFKGEFVSFEKIKLNIFPWANRNIPIVIGGHSINSAKRAARLGDGFFPAVSNFDTIVELISVMKNKASEIGRDWREIEITCSGGLKDDEIKKLADLGVDRFVTGPFAVDEESLKKLLSEFVERIERLTGA